MGPIGCLGLLIGQIIHTIILIVTLPIILVVGLFELISGRKKH